MSSYIASIKLFWSTSRVRMLFGHRRFLSGRKVLRKSNDPKLGDRTPEKDRARRKLWNCLYATRTGVLPPISKIKWKKFLISFVFPMSGTRFSWFESVGNRWDCFPKSSTRRGLVFTESVSKSPNLILRHGLRSPQHIVIGQTHKGAFAWPKSQQRDSQRNLTKSPLSDPSASGLSSSLPLCGRISFWRRAISSPTHARMHPTRLRSR